MRRKWRLQLGTEALVIIPKTDLYPVEIATVEPWRIAASIDRWLADPISRQVALEMYEATHGSIGPEPRRVSADELYRRVKPFLERAFIRRELVALPVQLRSGEGNGAATGQEKPGSPSPLPGPRPPKKATWIEIELLVKGKPVANERYRIQAPDGTFHNGNLDGSGRARITGIEPGECLICFPDIDGGEWGALRRAQA